MGVVTSPMSRSTRQLLQLVADLAPPGAGRAHAPGELAVTTVFVEQPRVAGARQQRVMFVLAVHVDQLIAERFQVCERCALAVDPGAAAPVTRHHAA